MQTIVESAGCSLALTMPQSLEHLLEDQYVAHIVPEFKIRDFGDADSTLVLQEGDTPTISGNVIRAPWTGILPGQFAHLLLYALQEIYMKKGFLYFHAGAIELDGDAILLIGPSRGGKSLLTKVAGTKGIAGIIGDDGILVREWKVVGGNRLISVLEDKEKYVTPEELGARRSYEGTVKAVIFLEPEILTELRVQKCSEIETALRLYQATSEDARGVGYCLLTAGIALPSHDTTEFAQRRLASIRAKAKNIVAHRLGGRYEVMIKWFQHYLTKKEYVSANS